MLIYRDSDGYAACMSTWKLLEDAYRAHTRGSQDCFQKLRNQIKPDHRDWESRARHKVLSALTRE